MAALIGVHEKWTSPDFGRTPADVKVRFPGADIGRPFVNELTGSPENLRPKALSALQPHLDAQVKVAYLSIKTPRNDTRNGLWDGQYRTLADYLMVDLKNQYPNTEIKFIPWHEPEDDMTGLQFQGYFNRVRDTMKAAQPNLKVCAAYMTYQWAPNWNNTASIGGKTDVPSDWLVTADEYCVDVYSGRSFPLDQILPEHPGFARWYATLLPAGASYTVTERGFETPNTATGATHNTEANYPLRNDTIAREFAWLKTQPDGLRCTNYIYWNSSGTEESSHLKLDGTGEDALATAIASMTAPPPPPPAPTEEELRAAYDRGYEAGRASRQGEVDAAFAAGQTSGRTVGRTEGEDAKALSLLNQFAQILAASIPTYPA